EEGGEKEAVGSQSPLKCVIPSSTAQISQLGFSSLWVCVSSEIGLKFNLKMQSVLSGGQVHT
ncbi:hypothetical protein ACQP3J_33280, partial [Escherichia coli]